MKSSEMLRKAKDFLWDGVSPRAGVLNTNVGICYALICAVGRDESPRVHQEIGRRLAPYGYVDNWLHHIAGVPWEQLTPENVQAYRHRWLEHLIKEYESKGD